MVSLGGIDNNHVVEVRVAFHHKNTLGLFHVTLCKNSYLSDIYIYPTFNPRIYPKVTLKSLADRFLT